MGPDTGSVRCGLTVYGDTSPRRRESGDAVDGVASGGENLAHNYMFEITEPGLVYTFDTCEYPLPLLVTTYPLFRWRYRKVLIILSKHVLHCTAQAAASQSGIITFVSSRDKGTLRLPMSLPGATTAGRARQSMAGCQPLAAWASMIATRGGAGCQPRGCTTRTTTWHG